MIFIGKCLTCDLKFIVHNILLIWLVMVGTVGHLTCPLFHLVLYEYLYHCYCWFVDYSYDDFSNIYSVMVILSQLYQKLSRSLTDFSIVVLSPFKNLSLIQHFSKISMDTKTLQKKSKVYIYILIHVISYYNMVVR